MDCLKRKAHIHVDRQSHCIASSRFEPPMTETLRNCPEALCDQITKAHNNGAVVQFVAVGVDGDWFLNTDKFNCTLVIILTSFLE
jgi:hypothetical protein